MAREVTFTVGIEGGETRQVKAEIHELDAAPWGLGAKLNVVGTDVPRLDGPAKATGTARYTYDVRRPGLAYARLVTVHVAHAKVKSVDLSAADRLRGVLATEVLVPPGGRITFAGQAVAAVCAETEEVLDDAVHAVRVEIEPLPSVVTTHDAMSPGAPEVDEGRSNVRHDARRGVEERGDPDAALAKSHKVVEAVFRTQVQTHSALEPHGSLIEPNDDGSVTVWASTQATGSFQEGIARSLRLGADKVRVITEHMGGGFGAKFGVDAWDEVAARFAVKLSRPVRAMLDRRSEHLVAGNRPDSIQRLRLGADRDGRITALVGETFGTAGNAGSGAGVRSTVLYRIPNLRFTQSTVTTFASRGRAFRAPGSPQGVFALDGAMDMLAHEMGMDPLEFRELNDPHPVRQVQWRIGADTIGWKDGRNPSPGSGEGRLRYGMGCAASFWFQKGGGDWVVNLRVDPDGAVTASSAVQDLGTGTRTVIAILVAEELGLDPARVTVRAGDTNDPAGPGSGGSTTAPSVGPAAREAGLRARERLCELLAEDWGVKAGEVAVGAGVFTGPGGRSARFEEACALLRKQPLSVSGQRRRNYAGFEDLTAGCQFASVEVDVETGVVRVLRVVAVQDAGRIVNSLASRSQLCGGVIQGISYALFEDRLLDRGTGDMVNGTLDTYRIAGIADCPRIDAVLTSIESGFNNSGIMGLGEPATVATAAAVANAVFNATGVRMFDLPMTPARVLAALGRLG